MNPYREHDSSDCDCPYCAEAADAAEEARQEEAWTDERGRS